MKDIERALHESLSVRAETYRPADVDAAERRFLERRSRRRIVRAGGGAVLAAAAVVAVFALARPELVTTPEPRLEPAGLRIAERFDVAEEPLAVSVSPGAVWVASREAGVVSRIDPSTGSTERVTLQGANEVLVDEENAWAAGSEGTTLRIDAETVEVTEEIVQGAGAEAVELAVGGHEKEAVWMLDASGCLTDLTNRDPDQGCQTITPGFHATDIATSTNETWVLDGETGVLDQFFAGGVNRGRSLADADGPIPTAPAGRYSDLLITTAGNDAIWVSGDDGQLMRLDLVTGEEIVSQLDGDYADLAAGAELVWALVGHEGSDRGDLVAIDTETGKPVGEVLVLSGKPSDIVATPDGVWITLRTADQVLQIVAPRS